MATGRTSTTTRKPRGAVKPPAAPRQKVVPVAIAEAEMEQWEADNEPLPDEPEPEPARFPYEQVNGQDPVAVFNTCGGETSWNERLAYSRGDRPFPLEFRRGVLAVFDEEDAEFVREQSLNGRLYQEAEKKFEADPIICTTCVPATRWYSQNAYVVHTQRMHAG